MLLLSCPMEFIVPPLLIESLLPIPLNKKKKKDSFYNKLLPQSLGDSPRESKHWANCRFIPVVSLTISFILISRTVNEQNRLGCTVVCWRWKRWLSFSLAVSNLGKIYLNKNIDFCVTDAVSQVVCGLWRARGKEKCTFSFCALGFNVSLGHCN